MLHFVFRCFLKNTHKSFASNRCQYEYHIFVVLQHQINCSSTPSVPTLTNFVSLTNIGQCYRASTIANWLFQFFTTNILQFTWLIKCHKNVKHFTINLVSADMIRNETKNLFN